MDFTERKQALEARRVALAGHLREVEHTLDAPMPKDWEDRSSERQGDEVLETLGLNEMEELRQIDAALARLVEGSYGYCQICGDAIAEKRLDLIPATPFCSGCAS
ncbi:TraR/DksA family transcriptional regulator [Pseudophaeobacter arcticus]|jgi:RNA polymerase-binding transcription factor DksA|uniref:TraR/DksA family transcriptional regulator n=1 Tax=Pseudophaeobacter arcticus TaxID=385492 RepID=UPI0004046819|nr:TraR/DksA family transcriptional regulator [Pseudophaeobacter arcticus]